MTNWYSRLVIITDLPNNQVEIECPLGLWGVIGKANESTEEEAKHYFNQYFADGEYNKLMQGWKR